MKKIIWWILLALLTIADAYLIAKPNLLGKLGFIIYKYHYLRTFPRALVTVAIVVVTVLVLTEVLVWLFNKQILSRKAIVSVLIFLLLIFSFALIKTALDFQSWSFSHSGHKLKYGAYLLPIILILIVGTGLLQVLVQKPKFPESPLNEKLT
jgi:hypothetical protein